MRRMRSCRVWLRTTASSRPPSLRAGLVIAALLTLAVGGCGQLPSPAPDPPPPAVVSVEEFESWRSTTAWRSQEELLQFFVEHNAAYRARGAIVPASVLQHMAAELHSMFPLASCTRLLYADGLLHISLTSNLRVHVPGAYHQAFLSLPQELVFRVTPSPDERHPWVFHVEASAVRLEFSWLAKLLGPSFLHDLDIEQLDYTLDRSGHHSYLAVREGISRSGDGTILVNGRPPSDPASTQRYLQDSLRAGHAGMVPPHAAVTVTGNYVFDLEARHLRQIDIQVVTPGPDHACMPASAPPPSRAAATATPRPALVPAPGPPQP